MFRYDDIKKMSQPGEIQRRRMTKIRKVTYFNNGIASEGFEPVQEKVFSPDSDESLFTPEISGSKTVTVEAVILKPKKTYESED